MLFRSFLFGEHLGAGELVEDSDGEDLLLEVLQLDDLVGVLEVLGLDGGDDGLPLLVDGLRLRVQGVAAVRQERGDAEDVEALLQHLQTVETH